MKLLSRRDLACQQAVEMVTDYLEGSLSRSARRRFAGGGLVYLLVIGLAFASAPAAFALSGAVAVYYVFERTPSGAGGPSGDSAAR